MSRRTVLGLCAAGAAAGALGALEPARAAVPEAGWVSGRDMWVGANRMVHTPDGKVLGDVAAWRAASAKHGPWTVRRTYSPTMASTIAGSLGADMVAAGVHIHHSAKPPDGVSWRQAADGRYDAAIDSLARSMPTSGPTWLTFHHEPEGSAAALNKPDAKGTPEDFVAFHQHCYRIVKAANPNVQVGPIHMSYQWQTGSASTSEPQRWFVGDEYADFVGVDAYWAANDATLGHPSGLQDHPHFRRWYGWARPAYARARFGLLEFGYQYAKAQPALRGHCIRSTGRFLTGEGFFTLQYWDVVGERGWGLDDVSGNGVSSDPGDVAAITAYREICAGGLR